MFTKKYYHKILEGNNTHLTTPFQFYRNDVILLPIKKVLNDYYMIELNNYYGLNNIDKISIKNSDIINIKQYEFLLNFKKNLSFYYFKSNIFNKRILPNDIIDYINELYLMLNKLKEPGDNSKYFVKIIKEYRYEINCFCIPKRECDYYILITTNNNIFNLFV